MDTDEAVRQLKQLKVWVAVGAIGFLLIGVAAITFAVSTASVMAAMDKEFGKDNGCGVQEDFDDIAAGHYEKGQLKDLEKLISERTATHPNDANVFWYGARLHAIRGEWDQALSDLDQTVLLAPSWEKKYVEPLEKEIIKRKGAVK